MPAITSKRLIAGLTALALILSGGIGIDFAQAVEDATIASEINTLKQEIDEKQANIDHISNKIDSYKSKIEAKQQEAATLGGEVDLLENRIKKTELDIELAEQQIEATNSELRLIDKELHLLEDQLDRDREILKGILQKMQTYQNSFDLQVLFSTDSFSEVFERLQHLENVNDDLSSTLTRAKENRDQLADTRTNQEGKKVRLVELSKHLERSKQLSEQEQNAKESLLLETQKSEAEFNALLYALRQEQQYIDQQIALLQGEIEAKLNASDQAGDSSIISWPVDPSYRGISTYFHDPTYPFRHLFEHSGLDIPQRQGTPLKAAAPGYVAWARTGRLYGNYVMIIHTNGMATLYAHMSRINVAPDQFVGRGEIIGATGGMPGTPGAGLSTGPHLHFEVRKNGIPVNPLDYMVDAL